MTSQMKILLPSTYANNRIKNVLDTVEKKKTDQLSSHSAIFKKFKSPLKQSINSFL